MKAREAIREVLRAGAEELRSHGDHRRFWLPRTRVAVTVYQGGRRSELTPGIAAKLSKALAAERRAGDA